MIHAIKIEKMNAIFNMKAYTCVVYYKNLIGNNDYDIDSICFSLISILNKNKKFVFRNQN